VAFVEFADAFFADVEAHHRPFFGELHREGEADVAEANNGNFWGSHFLLVISGFALSFFF